MKNIIFIHGLESSGKGFKAKFLKGLFPEIITPTFFPHSSNFLMEDILKERMKELEVFLREKSNWIIIGSSFGGLMASIYALKNPERIKFLVLLAPFLTFPRYYDSETLPINIPVFAIHGINDRVVLARKARKHAKNIFTNLEYILVNDDHSLHQTVVKINWDILINSYPNEKKIVPSEIIRQWLDSIFFNKNESNLFIGANFEKLFWI